jgi:biotin carboxyl carrier protein
MTAPTWQDAYDVVAHLVARGHTDITLRLAGATPPEAPEADRAPVHAVVAPVVGTFYRRPAPGQPPFVEVGDEVAEETVVAIVEVMKLMVPVEAGIAGRIERALVDDASPVEEGQALFEVAPVGAGTNEGPAS